MLLRWVMASMIAGLFGGCTLDRNAIGGATAEDATLTDAAGIDAFVVPGEDSGPRTPDAFVVPGEDGGPDEDGGPGEDGGPACMERCSGNIAVTCPGEVPEDCGTAARCVADGAGARCEPLLCVPGTMECSMDGSAALICRDGGMGQDSVACDRGCDAVTRLCRPETACRVSGVVAVEAGDTVAFDTCGWVDDWTLESGDVQCPSGPANGEDRIVRLQVPVPGMYRIELRDVDGARRVDPVVYLRRACDDEGSQIACDDDIDSANLDARLDAMLAAGDYFLVLDAYEYEVPATDYTCGSVELTIERL